MTLPNSMHDFPRRSTRHAFTLVELLVAVGILIILLGIFIPYGLSLRETSRRMQCTSNLLQIRDALSAYSRDNGNAYPRVVFDPGNPGYTAFTGADASDPFAVARVQPSTQSESATQPATAATAPATTQSTTLPAFSPGMVQANDVSASLWLLVRTGFVKDTGIFICPSSGDTKDPLDDAGGRFVKPGQRSNFRKPSNLSYSYASPFSTTPGYELNDTRKSGFVLLADKNPGIGDGSDVTSPQHDATTLELAKANSRNHGRAGQNVVYIGGSYSFLWTPYCGVGREPILNGKGVVTGWKPGDNIYTVYSKIPLVEDPVAPYGNGFFGRTLGPSWTSDTYLVPTAQDGNP